MTNLVAGGSASESLHTGEPSKTAKHEIGCGGAYDSFIGNRRLGRWLFLCKPRFSQSDVWQVEQLFVNSSPTKLLVEDFRIQLRSVYICYFLHVDMHCFRRVYING